MGLSPWFLERRENQEIYQLEFGETLLGRTETTQIVITSVFASRKHCRITVSQENPDEVYLEDLGTCNGTYVNTAVKNGEKIRLKEGDNIGIGCTIADHDDEKYYTFTVKRDNVPIENIIINLDDDEEEEEDEEEDEDDEVEDVSIEEIEDDPVEEVILQETEDDPVEVILERKEKIVDVPVEEVIHQKTEDDLIEKAVLERKEKIVEDPVEEVTLEQEEETKDDAAEEVAFKQEQEIEKELSFSLKQEMLDDIIEIDDIFSECDNNIEDDDDLFRQYEMKQEQSMREQNSDIVLISDSEDEDIKEMNNWVLKLSQNFESKKVRDVNKTIQNIKRESDEENNDADILNELRSAFGHLPDTETKMMEKAIEPIIPKIEIDDDELQIISDQSLPASPKVVNDTSVALSSILTKSGMTLQPCSVVLEKISLETKSDYKQDSDSDDQVQRPPKKIKRLLTNEVLFGSDEGDAGAIDSHKNERKPEGITHSKTSDKIQKRKSSHDYEQRRRSSSREMSDRSGSSSSKMCSSKYRNKRYHSTSKETSKSKSESKYTSRHDRPRKEVCDKSNKTIISEPEPDSDFVEKDVSKSTEETIKTKPDHKKCRQLEIIEPLNMPKRKRFNAKEKTEKSDKSKSSDDLNRTKNRFIMNEKHQNHVQDMNIKFKQGSSGKKTKIPETLIVERKKRLFKLTKTKKCDKSDDEGPKVVNTPKVKVTEQNRGSFLTEALPCTIPGRRKSVSVTEKRNHDKPVQDDPKTLKPCSINDLGTVGKSISAFPKIPKVTRTTSLESNMKSPSLPKLPNLDLAISLQTSLTKTALKPRVARAGIEENHKSPTPPCTITQLPIQESEILPKKSNLIKRSEIQQSSKNPKPKKVRFSDKVNILEFEVTHDKKLLNVSEAQYKENSIAKLKKLNGPPIVTKPVEVSPIFHPCENILNDITGWNTDWLKLSPNILPPINGSNILLPIVHTYRNCMEYENIMIPLLKVELWHQIRNDYELRKNYRCCATVVNAKLVTKGNGKRYELVCELQNNITEKIRDQVKEGMMLKVSTADKHFFAYMIFKDCMRTRDREVTYITIQSTQSDITDKIKNEMVIEITWIAYIRVEIINMGFIYDLKESPLCDMILNPPIHIDVPSITDEYNPSLDLTLNKCQYNIVNYATQQCLDTSKPSIVLIDGPPGTGKSYLISNLVSTLLFLPENTKLKILICSATNNAIDIIMEKLLDIRKKNKNVKNQRDIRLIRFGVEEKMSPVVKPYSVQNLSRKNIETWQREIASSSMISGTSLKTLLAEQKVIEKRISNLKQNGCSSNNIEELVKLEKSLDRIKSIAHGNHIAKNELNNKKKQLATSLTCKADIICTTLTSCVQLMRTLKTMDVCIIDEATQCTEPWSIIPLKFKIKKLILVGDTKQLPAVVLSTDAKENGLGNSLFTRIQQSFEVIAATPVLPMTTQYRMHPEICEFPSKYFYNNQLKSSYKINADVPLRPYSVISIDFMQNGTYNNLSIYNTEEARFISHLLYQLSKLMDFKKVAIGIITPYQKQKIEISKALNFFNLNDIQVNTIDSFQGKEADIIILATTRTIGTGFLSHPQRLNVALTRARHSLIICGNFIKLKNVPIWSSLVEDAIVRQVFYKFNDDFTNLLPKLQA